LQNGFIYFPVPILGFGSYERILSISRSPEMEDWQTFNEYDRPIPRRILETKGVPRELFGWDKKATTVLFSVEGLESTMTPKSLEEFRLFERKNASAVARKQAKRFDRICALGKKVGQGPLLIERALIKLRALWRRGFSFVGRDTLVSLEPVPLEPPIRLPTQLAEGSNSR
jgi:hypothetical protein